jgi:hypothetical protein
MSLIDRKRIAAVATLEALGFSFETGAWQPPGAPVPETLHGDTILGLLHDRAEALIGRCEASAEEAELKAIGSAIEAYEQERWPDGKVPGGKG